MISNQYYGDFALGRICRAAVVIYATMTLHINQWRQAAPCRPMTVASNTSCGAHLNWKEKSVKGHTAFYMPSFGWKEQGHATNYIPVALGTDH